MGRYGSDFKEPPWVVGSPKEVMDWAEGNCPSKKDEKDRASEKRRDGDFLKNLHIQFDFEVSKREIEPKNIFSKLFLKVTRNEMIEEDFDLISKAELILRALAKAKFRNIAKLVVDGKTLYNHPEKKSDLRKAIDGIDEFSHEIRGRRSIKITAVLADVEKCTANIEIKRIHSKKEHSVDIQMTGEIKKELYRTFLNYLNQNLCVKEEVS